MWLIFPFFLRTPIPRSTSGFQSRLVDPSFSGPCGVDLVSQMQLSKNWTETRIDLKLFSNFHELQPPPSLLLGLCMNFRLEQLETVIVALSSSPLFVAR